MPPRNFIPYDQNLKPLARDLRQLSTLAEVLLWNQLKQRQMRGYRFLRQRPIDKYIVDFFCKELHLAIEVDGSNHNLEAQLEKDPIRQKRIEALGVCFLRFTDHEVKKNLHGVLQQIENWILEFEKSRL